MNAKKIIKQVFKSLLTLLSLIYILLTCVYLYFGFFSTFGADLGIGCSGGARRAVSDNNIARFSMMLGKPLSRDDVSSIEDSGKNVWIYCTDGDGKRYKFEGVRTWHGTYNWQYKEIFEKEEARE